MQAEWRDENRDDATRIGGFLLETGHSVLESEMLLVVNQITIGAVFNLANVHHTVGALNYEVDLGITSNVFFCRTSPRVISGFDGLNAKRLLDFGDVGKTNTLKGQASPSVDCGRVLAFGPEMFVVFNALDELQIESCVEICQLVQPALFGDFLFLDVVEPNQVAVNEIVQHFGKPSARFFPNSLGDFLPR